MKLIIKNDSKETVKNPNVKIIETTEASFTNQTVFIEENDVPIIKYTDTESMYFVKDLDNLYDRKSKSEVLLNITIDNLELIGGGSGGDFIPLSGTEVGSPVSGDIEIIDGVSIIPDPLGGVYYLGDIRKTALGITVDGITVSSNSPLLSRGLTSEGDFTPNITDLDYTQKKYVDQKVADSRPYKVYTALLTQSGTNAPVATVLENTLDYTPTYTYNGVGGYSIILEDTPFTEIILPTRSTFTTLTTAIIIRPEDANLITINTSEATIPTDAILVDFFIEIRVYN